MLQTCWRRSFQWRQACATEMVSHPSRGPACSVAPYSNSCYSPVATQGCSSGRYAFVCTCTNSRGSLQERALVKLTVASLRLPLSRQVGLCRR